MTSLSARTLACLLLASASLCLLPASSGQDAAPAAGGRWLGPDGRPLPFTAADEVLAFLSSAEVVTEKELTGGTNRPLKVRLRRRGIEANAIFRRVDVFLPHAKIDGKVIRDFHDSHVYECAAWEVSRLLGIDNVPPCVERRYRRIDGTMQLWVEEATTELERRERGLDPPSQVAWMRQKQTMRLFDALIDNFDRNQGNMLIGADWKLWFIDHTRSFRKSLAVENPKKIVWCEQGVFERLKALDKRTLSQRLKSIDGQRVYMLLKRRDLLVQHLESLIAASGEGSVLWDAADPGAGATELPAALAEDDIPLTSSQVEGL